METPLICDHSVRDALSQSPQVSMTCKRKLFGVDKGFRALFAKYFAGKLEQIYLHRSDCTHSNAKFLLEGRLAYREESGKYKGNSVFKGVDGWTFDMKLYAKGTAKYPIDVGSLPYAHAFFLGHALVHWGLDIYERAPLRLGNGEVVNSLNDIVGDAHKRSNLAFNENNNPFCAILQGAALQEALRRCGPPNLEAGKYGDVELDYYLLDDEAMGTVAPKLLAQISNVDELSLCGNPFGPVGLRALFPDVGGGNLPQWFQLGTLHLANASPGVASALLAIINESCTEAFANLSHLNLTGSGLTNDDMRKLWDCIGCFESLKILDVSSNPFGDEGFAPLSRKGWPECKINYRETPMASLEELQLRALKNVTVDGYTCIASAVQDGCFPQLNTIAAPDNTNRTGALQMALKVNKYQRAADLVAKQLRLMKIKTETCINCGPIFYSPTSPGTSRPASPSWERSE